MQEQEDTQCCMRRSMSILFYSLVIQLSPDDIRRLADVKEIRDRFLLIEDGHVWEELNANQSVADEIDRTFAGVT